jgi:sugar/nucleoside kinase (ribokinase family)
VLVEQMRMTAAGTAAGSALTFAKLGAAVRTAGAIGTDPAGDLLVSLLGSAGIDTSLVVCKPDAPTSMSVLPIRPNGDQPSLHLLGANLAYTLDDVEWDAVAAADHLHLGGAELLGPDFASRILRHARENGVSTSVDLIAPGGMGTFDIIAPAMAYTDYLLPNEDQVLGFTGAADLADGCRRLLDAGAGLLAVTCGADGALIVDREGSQQVPAFAVDVVDTTGCGGAFLCRLRICHRYRQGAARFRGPRKRGRGARRGRVGQRPRRLRPRSRRRVREEYAAKRLTLISRLRADRNYRSCVSRCRCNPTRRSWTTRRRPPGHMGACRPRSPVPRRRHQQ